MLKLSELEAEKEPVKEKVDLVKVAAEVKENLSAFSDKKDITVTVEGEGTVEMEKEHAEELVKNLMENAVRYNNNGAQNHLFFLIVVVIDCENELRTFFKFCFAYVAIFFASFDPVEIASGAFNIITRHISSPFSVSYIYFAESKKVTFALCCYIIST